MTLVKTLTIVKPDGVHQRVVGEIIHRFEAEGFRIAAMKMVHLCRPQGQTLLFEPDEIHVLGPVRADGPRGR